MPTSEWTASSSPSDFEIFEGAFVSFVTEEAFISY